MDRVVGRPDSANAGKGSRAGFDVCVWDPGFQVPGVQPARVDYSKYDFSTFEQDTRLAASFLNATSPNLDEFNKHGSKLILWHGWADTALPAQATADYYHQVRMHDPKAAEYCRLFLIPGCLHCGGGPGAAEVDWLAVISDWVERAKAPDVLIASKHDHGKLVMTRPLFPYPQVAVYKGSGDGNSAESFAPKSAAAESR
jgi:hypothetical protein